MLSKLATFPCIHSVVAEQIAIFTVRNEVAKVMFLQVCVCPQGGVPDQVHPPQDPGTPPGPGTPPRQVHPPDQVHPPVIRPLLRTVRILLECILVRKSYCLHICHSVQHMLINFLIYLFTISFSKYISS